MVEFNHLPRSNDKICDNDVFADRFRCQLTTFEIRILVSQSRFLHANMAYEIAAAKITARICRNSHCFSGFDRIVFIRLPTLNDKIYDNEAFADRFRYQLTMFEIRIFIGLSRVLHDHIAYEIVISKIITVNLHDVGNDLPCRTLVKS